MSALKFVRPKCGNADLDKFIAEVVDAGRDMQHLRGRQVRLVGWKCQICKHIIRLES